MRLGRVGVELVAHQLRGDTLVDQALRIAGLRPGAHAGGAGAADRYRAHRLDAGCDDDVVGSGEDRLGRERCGLLAGAALAVQCRAGHGLGEPGAEHGVAADVAGLFPHLLGTPGDDVLDQGRVDSGPLDEGTQLAGQQITRVDGGQRTSLLALADRGSHGVDDDGVLHSGSPTRHDNIF